MTLLSAGNAAKLYCLEWVDRLAAERDGALRIVDLGCGTAAGVLELLRRRPAIEYVGVEPDAAACAVARAALPDPRATVLNAPAYDVDAGPADVVLSFSVLEHVYRRDAYLACIARHLRPDGQAFVNYDAGHFVGPGGLTLRARENAKTVVGQALARTGRESRYQRFVGEGAFRAAAERAGLAIVDAKAFNTDLKTVYKRVPEHAREDFMRRWLDLELFVNEAGLDYTDDLARVFRTRNFVLRHRPSARG